MEKRPPTMTLILDAMGVIYPAADDVAELLVPFIQECGGESECSKIESLYREASLGRLTSAEFWRSVHLDPAVEDDYLARHRLSPGALEFLETPPVELAGIWCLSNDVSEWSRKLRDRSALSQFIRGFIISGDVGGRKPDAAIFRRLLSAIAAEPHQTIFVDDRQPNLDTARLLGIETILFAPGGSAQSDVQRTANDFHALRELITDIADADERAPNRIP